MTSSAYSPASPNAYSKDARSAADECVDPVSEIRFDDRLPWLSTALEFPPATDTGEAVAVGA